MCAGFSVYLVKENIVPSGLHVLLLEVSDLQGNSAFHNLSVIVCNCLEQAKPDCRSDNAWRSTIGKTVGIVSSCLVPLTGEVHHNHILFILLRWSNCDVCVMVVLRYSTDSISEVT